MAIRLGIGVGAHRDAATAGPPPGPFDSKSVEFDGVNEMLSRPSASVTGIYPDWTDPWTVNAWVRSTERSGATMFFGRQLTAGTMRGFSVGLYVGAPFVFISHDTSAAYYIQQSQTQTVAFGRWVMLTFKYTGATGSAADITMYINGVPQGSFPQPSGFTWWDRLGAASIQGGADLTLGMGSNLAYFNGKMADCSFWSVALSDAEVTALYNSAGAGQFGQPLDISGYANLEGWWRMGDGAGDDTGAGGEVFDQSGNGNDVAPSNMTASNIVSNSPGSFWNNVSCGFDGVDERVNVGNDASFSGTGDFTAAAWFKTSAGGTADIFGKWAGLGSRDWVLFLNSGAIQGYMQDGAGGVPFAGTSASTYNDGAWHLAVMTFNSTAGELTIDLDGGTDRVTVAVASRMGSSGSDVMIAARDNGSGGGTSHLSGRVDEPAFWSSALSASEIVELYNGGAPVSPVTHSANASLLHWWRMGDNTFDSVASSQAACFDVVGSSDGWQSNMENSDMGEDVP